MSLLIIVGIIAMVIGSIGLMIKAFSESLLWGLGCLFFQPVGWIFVILHWQEAKNPFLLQVAGVVLTIIGVALSGPSSRTGP
jgi:hypothetical protein